jgi:hypothetical protein
MSSALRTIFIAFLIGFLPYDAVAQSNNPATPTTVFTPGAAAVVSGLTGLVTGTKTGLDGYRAASRALALRGALMRALMRLDNLDQQKEIRIAATNVDILCATRAAYATHAAEAAYITSITGTLDKFATPPKIASIADAFQSIFQNYTIDASNAKVSPTASSDITAKCESDIAGWVMAYYGADVVKPLQGAGGLSFGIDPVTTLNTFADLFQTLITIITPIVTVPATALEAKRRSDAINGFLKKYRDDLLKAASDIAGFGDKTGTATRLQAVGAFAESMAAVRSVTIDVSKFDACKTAYKTVPGSLVLERKDAAGNVVSRLPTDDFAVCYAQSWSQLKSAAEAAVAAAAQYDSISDNASDQLAKAVQIIQKNIAKIDQSGTPDISQLVSAATQLITYGQAVTQALSAANITKVKTDVQNIMKQFGG